MILEIHRKHSDRVEYARMDTLPVHIGRGYGNDLILDDPYLSPEHAILNETENGWLLEDRGSENGIKLGDKGEAMRGPVSIQAGDLFILGETQIRIVTPEMQVEPTRIQHSAAWYLHLLTHPAMAWLLCLLACLAVSFVSYLESSTEFELKELAITVAIMVSVQLLWAGAWAFAGRTLKKRPCFHRQLSIFAAYILLSIPLDILVEYLEYLTNSLLVGELLAYLMSMVPFAVVLYLSLWIATAMQKRRRVVVAGLVTGLFGLFALSIGMDTSSSVETQAKYSTVLKPSYAPTKPAVTIDSFFADSARLIEGIEIEDQ